jgi:hypothetical protein
MTSVPAAPSSTPPDTLTRWVAGFLVLILVDAAQLLEFYPDRTDTLWAWTIQPPLTAMLLGSVYTAGAYFFVRVMFGAPWERVAAGFPAIALFVWMAAIATALHLDRFHEDSLPFLAWAALYITTPLAVPWLYLRNRRPLGGPPLPRGVRLALGAAGAAGVAAGLVLFVAPDLAIDSWPYALTPLTARITATVIALYAGVWLSLALIDRQVALRIPLQAHVIGLAVVLVSCVRGEDAVVLAAVAAAMLAVSAVLAWKAP